MTNRVGRVVWLVAGSANAAIAAFVYQTWKHSDPLAPLGGLLAGALWGVVALIPGLVLLLLPDRARRVGFWCLLCAAWVPPLHKVARYAVVEANARRCQPLSGRPLDECEAADCLATPRCVAGGRAELGLCLDDGTPLSPVHCQVKGDVCMPMWPRCASVSEARCHEVTEKGRQVCEWRGGRCVDLVAVCGACQRLAKRCDAMPFEVTWKAPWNER